ncbi:S-adenosyl-L-methionine-dependent methyltransferase [Mycena metata]|uniref:S-adenosyl-L-methionine-dependent methyltransferase n=1 Tax=Mycena metata TaxID=1033252 RepID=A0AAD7JJY0_9AGAR|nr:S-adenosyl-L-methionine-dependent methyltransferase [Mycena metata]
MSLNSDSYVLEHASVAPTELERLDRVHNAFTQYFEGQISLAPLEDFRPEKILEIGSGGGAWAIAAALKFPGSSVTAIDQHPIPQRDLPPNLVFQAHDISRPLPFTKGIFDIVHCRLVLLHIPKGETVLQHIAEFVRPGGWLLLEEPDDYITDGNYGVAETTTLVRELHKIMRATGANPCIGGDLERLLRGTNSFSEVNIRKVVIPFPSAAVPLRLPEEGSVQSNLGMTWKESYIQIARNLAQNYAMHGITDQVLREFLEDMNDPHKNLTSTIYFAWSRRKVVAN